MEIDSYRPGVPCWIDTASADPQRSADFYSALFGWEVFDVGDEGGNYRMCYLRDKPVAGIGPQPDPNMPSVWTTYFKAVSADETADKIQAAGGQPFMEAFDVLTVGRMFVYADDAGAVSAVWQPMDHHGAGLANEPGTFCWNELMTDDVDKSIAFYTSVYPWTANKNLAEDGSVAYVEFQVDGDSIAGMMPRPPMVPPEVPPHWLTYFAVADADASIAKAVELGGTQASPTMDIPIGRFSVMTDPLGAVFAVIALAEQ